ncbi:MAG: nucleotidyltransferase domain-containing protein [Acidobacteria bacterium]|jgi:predicted nucleotidyltransferase|nr:nucleotidyltransferase domain-containing protein [Acidobacteriota bacterium]
MKDQDIRSAIVELKQVLIERLGRGIELYLYGSVARKDYGPQSDIDILLLVPGKVDTNLKEEIIDLAFYIEIKYNVVIQIITRSKEYWESGLSRVTPFHQNVRREGIQL